MSYSQVGLLFWLVTVMAVNEKEKPAKFI